MLVFDSIPKGGQPLLKDRWEIISKSTSSVLATDNGQVENFVHTIPQQLLYSSRTAVDLQLEAFDFG